MMLCGIIKCICVTERRKNMDLFEYQSQQKMKKESPLAARLRPTTLDEFVGQEHIVGKDTLLEEGRNLYEVLDLNMGKCKFAVAGYSDVKEKLESSNDLRVATKYPNIAKEYFYQKEIVLYY